MEFHKGIVEFEEKEAIRWKIEKENPQDLGML